MNKHKFYIWNAFWSSLIGLSVFIFALLTWGWQISYHQLINIIVDHPLSFLSNMLFSMAVGAIIGTVSLFFVFQIFLKLTQKPLIGFISNFVVVALMNIIGAIVFGVRTYQQFIQTEWFLALIISEALSFFLISHWYQRLKFYKEKLEQKKESLRKLESQ